MAMAWLAGFPSLADSELRRRSGKVARHIGVGTAWGRARVVDWRGAPTPGLCARGVPAVGAGSGRRTVFLVRQVAAVVHVEPRQLSIPLRRCGWGADC